MLECFVQPALKYSDWVLIEKAFVFIIMLLDRPQNTTQLDLLSIANHFLLLLCYQCHSHIFNMMG